MVSFARLRPFIDFQCSVPHYMYTLGFILERSHMLANIQAVERPLETLAAWPAIDELIQGNARINVKIPHVRKRSLVGQPLLRTCVPMTRTGNQIPTCKSLSLSS